METSTKPDLTRAIAATRTELRLCMDEVRDVQLNICKVYSDICAAELKHGHLDGSLKQARTSLRSSQLAFTLLQMTYIDIATMLRDAEKMPTENEVKSCDLQRNWMLALMTRDLAHKSHEEAQALVQEAHVAFSFAEGAVGQGQ
jgi:outer membrane protein TolC